ncbi:MAG TPA: hypothetical protein VMH05_14845 [Bryobacteraceae bacterium]|nr:hypothetical protein [Bryobacteraceae bacterium]
MRSLATIAGLGILLAGGAYAQSLSEHAAAAAGATIGTAAGKPISGALSGIFNQVDDTTATAAKTGNKAKAVVPPAPRTAEDKEAQTNRGGGPGGFSPGFGLDGGAAATNEYVAPRPKSVSRRQTAPLRALPAPVVAAVVVEPVKEPSLEEVASVKLGTTEKELFAALGKPESQVIVPADDGHMRESCQYWAKGKQLGTIRLDNGQVVRVEVWTGN